VVKKGKVVNKRELAQFFGLSPQAIDGWLTRGCPVLKKGGPLKGYQFDTAAVAEWRADQRVAEAISDRKSDTRDDDEKRIAAAEASLKELKLFREAGQLVTVEDAEQVWTKQVAAVRQKLLGIPTKLAPLVLVAETVEEARSILEADINEALNELADGTDSDDAPLSDEGTGEGSSSSDRSDKAAAEAEAERVGRSKGEGTVGQRGARAVPGRKV
jgi:terminase small subunit / prophage DNA-packing protein